MSKRCMIFYHKKRDTLGIPLRWGDFMNHPGNSSILIVELSKVKIHWNRILYFLGNICMCMVIKFLCLKTYMQRWKFISIAVNIIPKSFMYKYNLHGIFKKHWCMTCPKKIEYALISYQELKSCVHTPDQITSGHGTQKSVIPHSLWW